MGYTNAEEVAIDPPEVPDDSLKDELEDTGGKLGVVNAVYEYIRGVSVYDELIAPLTGDFNRIRANGDAWEKLGKEGLERISDNQEKNVDKLRQDHWTEGDAAAAFEMHIKGPWFAALYGAAYGCTWVKEGFYVLADKAIQIGQEAADMLNELLDILTKLASKFVPGAGWISAGIDILGDIFSGEIPYQDEIDSAINLIEAIIGLKDTLEALLEAANSFFEGAQSIVDAIQQIPSVNSGNDAVAAARTFQEGTEQVQQAVQDMKDNLAELNEHLDTIRDTSISGN